jgi:hypothetical protein
MPFKEKKNSLKQKGSLHPKKKAQTPKKNSLEKKKAIRPVKGQFGP